MENLEITCHAEASGVFKFHRVEWQDPVKHEIGSPETYRRCSYCGSINLYDLLSFIRQGSDITFDRTDNWKTTGKYYVGGIPNPLAGETIAIGRSYSDGAETPIMGTAGKDQFAKVKLPHLIDLPEPEFTELTKYIFDKTGVRWLKTEKGISWRIGEADVEAVEQ